MTREIIFLVPISHAIFPTLPIHNASQIYPEGATSEVERRPLFLRQPLCSWTEWTRSKNTYIL